MKIRKYLLSVIIVTLSFAVFALWAFSKPFSIRYINTNALLSSLGQISGLLGMTIFSGVMILGAVPAIGKLIGDPEIYKKHHFWGSLSFVLIAVHPLALASNFLGSSLYDAARFFYPSTYYWPKNFGLIALFLMLVLLAVTFLVKIPAKAWSFTHKFILLAFIFASLHMHYASSSFSDSIYLKYLMLSLAAAAIILHIFKITKDLIKRAPNE